MGVALLKHNQEAYEKITQAIADGKKKIAISHATGTGKSYLIAKLFEDYNNDKKLVLVPSTYICDQIQKLFEKYSIQNVDVILYQKLIKMDDKDIAAMDYDVVALDEYHHDAATKVWGSKVKTLIETHSETIFFGTSATPIKTDGVNAIDELFEGNCASDLPLSEGIAKKIVPLPKYVGALYTLDDELERLRKKVENATNTKEEKKEYYKKINTMRSQIEKSYGMPIILNKHIKNREGKYIVFCKNKTHLAEIKDTVIGWFRTAGFKDIHTYEVYSDYENKDADYNAFCNDTSHSSKLLFSIDVLNEGLHLENISGVLLLRPTRSSIVWHQQIGRAIEANNTNIPVIIDAVNNFRSAGQGMKLFKEIRGAVEKEKKSNPNFNDSEFEDIDTFFVIEQVVEIQEMFKEIEGRLEGREWTENEIEILKKWYPIEGGNVEKRLNGRTRCTIHTIACKLGIKAPDNFWTEEEINILKRYYPVEGIRVKSRLKWRTKEAIRGQVIRLDLAAPDDSWTKAEIELLKKYYPDYGRNTILFIPNKTVGAIKRRANLLRISYKKSIFTNEEDEILKHYYPLEGCCVYKRLDGKTKKQCISRAKMLGISCANDKKWTDEENEILYKYYPEEGERVQTRLNKRSKQAIFAQVSKLGIKPNKYWKEEEIEVLKKYYPIEGTKVVNRLNNKTKTSIISKANNLGLKRKRTSKYRYVHKIKNKYIVELVVNGNKVRCGTFDNEDEAGKVAMEKAKEYGKAI